MCQKRRIFVIVAGTLDHYCVRPELLPGLEFIYIPLIFVSTEGFMLK